MCLRPREVAFFELIMAGLSDVHASKSSAAVVPVMVVETGLQERIACKSRIVGLCRRSEFSVTVSTVSKPNAPAGTHSETNMRTDRNKAVSFFIEKLLFNIFCN